MMKENLFLVFSLFLSLRERKQVDHQHEKENDVFYKPLLHDYVHISQAY